jgi:phosphoglycolate phosphatase
MSKYKYVIWDWNGTLLNDVELCRSIINKILIKNDLPELSHQQYKNIFTFPVQDYYSAAGLDFNKTSFEILGKIFIDEYEERKYECSLFDGADEILSGIKQKGIRQSVLSAYKHDNLISILDKFRLTDYYEHIIGLDNIYAGGKSELGIKLREKINLKGAEILFVGDTLHDAEVAKQMKVDCVLLSAGHQAREKLKANGVPVLDNLNQLKKFILNDN